MLLEGFLALPMLLGVALASPHVPSPLRSEGYGSHMLTHRAVVPGVALPTAGAVAVPVHLRCHKSDDCAVRDVGNCCGRYVRCANRKAELPDPCPGKPGDFFGVCDVQIIDSCRCGSRLGCVGLQDGKVVDGREYD